MAKKRLITGIDVGTTKICSAIAEVTESSIEVIGTGWSQSKGLKRGVVVNLSDTIASVRKSLEKAESAAKIVVESAFVSVGGSFLQSRNTTARTDVRSKNGRVTSEDVDRAVESARELELPADYEIVHILTQGFSLDGQKGITNPLGMTGSQLTVNLHVVINASAVVQNILNAINKSEVIVNGVVIQQLASAHAVLTEDEKELGVVLVDIGGGTTDIAIFSNGSLLHSEVLPMGGSLITKDIAIGLKAPLNDAEQLKKGMGSVFPATVPDEEVVEVPEMGTGRNRTISRKLLCRIVEARSDEILDESLKVITRSGLNRDLMSGVVITGGGALLSGLVERAEQVFGMPVRLGFPLDFESKNTEVFHPAYSTALGLLKYAQESQSNELARAAKTSVFVKPKAIKERVRNWIFDRF
ncbi:MAG: cell division protein FtsA [Acidobacteriota bacterium]|nr:MAG: cell division protein FtsA [Acidobacteriota bacterium]